MNTQQPMIQHGFVDMNNHTWCDAWVDSYNRYTEEVNLATYNADRELLLDNRHKFFVWCMNELTV